MSISEIVIKVLGVILAVFGLVTLLGSVTGLPGTWIVCVVALVCLAGGIYIVRGGNFTA